MSVYHENLGGTEICGIGLTTNYTSAKATITLTGYGSADGAKLTFTTNRSDGVVYLYADGQHNKGNSGTRTDSYEWTKEGDCLRFVGWVNQKDNATDEHAEAGTLTATELILTFGNATYKVDIADITINNPSQS